ncbi:MAG: PEP-utilizing enzyme [Chloroflexota bacterium]
MDSTPAIQPGTAILPPADFPVDWPRPEDSTFHWTRDCEHNPHPITPMFASFAALTAGAGRALTVEPYQEAILARDDRQFNGFNYTRVILFDGSPEEIAARARRNREIVGRISLRLPEIWQNEWKPELEALHDFWRNFDLAGATFSGLAAHLETSIANATRLYEIHYRMGPPMWFALDEFEQFYCDIFPDATRLDAHRLLRGFSNQTLAINRHLWQLSRTARRSPVVRLLLCEMSPARARTELERMPEGRHFLGALDAFLQAFGHRSDLWDWGYPSWAEDPAPVFSTLRAYLLQPERNLDAALMKTTADRQQAVAEARAVLDSYPAQVIGQFERLLRAAQVALALTEDHTYYIDFNGFGWVRRVIAELGRRLAGQNRLNRPADVFYLTIGELHNMTSDRDLNFARRAADRAAEIARWQNFPAPAELGTRPAAPLRIYSADGRRMARYLGCWVAGDEAGQAGFLAYDNNPVPVEACQVLHGQPGSGGVVRGRARVITSLADADRLQAGDILVTTTTAPPWTPLFLTASGLVTDAGGLLSHGAVVAREFRLPAVVGTRIATAALQDGDWIEVDGNAGLVRLLA